jgi:hypothetical protein
MTGLTEGTRVKVTKINDGDAFFGEPIGNAFLGKPAIVVAHYPDEEHEHEGNGLRGGCSIDFDKSLNEILADNPFHQDDHFMVFADVDLEVL